MSYLSMVFAGIGRDVTTVFFPVVLWLSGKESTCHAGDTGDTRLIPGSGRSPWKRACPLTPVFWPGKFHGQRSLVGYNQ